MKKTKNGDKVISTMNDYVDWVPTMWSGKKNKKYGLRDDFVMTVGLAGEVGEVLEIIKKHVRSTRKKVYNEQHLIEEMGDVLYYWCMIAHRYNLSLDDIINANVNKLQARMSKNEIDLVERKKSKNEFNIKKTRK